MSQLQITGRNVTITPALREKSELILQHLGKHIGNISNAHLTLKVEKTVQSAEIQMHVRGRDLFAEASSEDLYKTLGLLEKKIKSQVDKLKEKQTDHHPHDVIHHGEEEAA